LPPEPEASSSESDDDMESGHGGKSDPAEAPLLRPRQKNGSYEEIAQIADLAGASSAEEESEWEDA
jgi:hypothetical protein